MVTGFVVMLVRLLENLEGDNDMKDAIAIVFGSELRTFLVRLLYGILGAVAGHGLPNVGG